MANHNSYYYCHTCEKQIHYMGIARHRLMHKDKREDCTITYASYGRQKHEYSKMDHKPHPQN